MEPGRPPEPPASLDPTTLNKNQKKKRRKALSKFYKALAQVGDAGAMHGCQTGVKAQAAASASGVTPFL